MISNRSSAPPAAVPLPSRLTNGRSLRRVVIASVCVGILCQLAQYLSRRSFWHDEAFLVLNVERKTAGALVAGPLNAVRAPQAAPALFLLLQRAIYRILGGSEYALRLLPLTFGVASLVLFAILARRILGPAGAAIAVTLFALSDRIIWHASESKPYAGDVLFATVLLLVACTRRSTHRPRRTLLRASLLTSVTLWFSYPALFVFTAISVSLAPAVSRQSTSRARGIAVWLVLNLTPAASLGALYFISIRHQQNPFFYAYWRDYFIPWSDPLQIPAWLVHRTYEYADNPYPHAGWLVLPLAILGCRSLWRQHHRSFLFVLIGPALLTLLAAGFHRYAFGGSRMTLFLTPATFLLVGQGTRHLKRVGSLSTPVARRRSPGELAPAAHRTFPIVPCVTLLLVAFGFVPAVYHLIFPRARFHIRPAIEYVRARRRPADAVYVYDHASGQRDITKYEFLCYWADAPADRLIHLDAPPVLATVKDARFWVVTSFPPEHRRDETRFLLRNVLGGRVPDDSYIGSGGAAFLVVPREDSVRHRRR